MKYDIIDSSGQVRVIADNRKQADKILSAIERGIPLLLTDRMLAHGTDDKAALIHIAPPVTMRPRPSYSETTRHPPLPSHQIRHSKRNTAAQPTLQLDGYDLAEAAVSTPPNPLASED